MINFRQKITSDCKTINKLCIAGNVKTFHRQTSSRKKRWLTKSPHAPPRAPRMLLFVEFRARCLICNYLHSFQWTESAYILILRSGFHCSFSMLFLHFQSEQYTRKESSIQLSASERWCLELPSNTTILDFDYMNVTASGDSAQWDIGHCTTSKLQ